MGRLLVELGGVAIFYLKAIDGELELIRSFHSVPPDGGYVAITNIYFVEDNMELALIT